MAFEFTYPATVERLGIASILDELNKRAPKLYALLEKEKKADPQNPNNLMNALINSGQFGLATQQSIEQRKITILKKIIIEQQIIIETKLAEQGSPQKRQDTEERNWLHKASQELDEMRKKLDMREVALVARSEKTREQMADFFTKKGEDLNNQFETLSIQVAALGGDKNNATAAELKQLKAQLTQRLEERNAIAQIGQQNQPLNMHQASILQKQGQRVIPAVPIATQNQTLNPNIKTPSGKQSIQNFISTPQPSSQAPNASASAQQQLRQQQQRNMALQIEQRNHHKTLLDAALLLYFALKAKNLQQQIEVHDEKGNEIKNTLNDIPDNLITETSAQTQKFAEEQQNEMLLTDQIQAEAEARQQQIAAQLEAEQQPSVANAEMEEAAAEVAEEKMETELEARVMSTPTPTPPK